VKERDVKIARLQQEIAQADQDLAHDLIAFQSSKFLNKGFWLTLASLSKRIMHSYLDLAAKNAWLAERALAYEQDRSIDIIRLDYFPVPLQGITGADLLQLDLSQLEASRLEGITKQVQVKHTFSLMRDFPFAFGQLKKTGQCYFKTEEAPFRHAYPGTYGYRIRNVTVVVDSSTVNSSAKGMLRNQGISLISRSDGKMHASTRFTEGLPLSEFQLRKDMMVFGLPDDTQLVFEGSGVETFWTLEFPSEANAYGIDNVADIMLTFDVLAQYSTDLYNKDRTSAPTSIQRLVFISALKFQPKSIDELKSGASSVNINFDMSSVGIPKKESNHKIKNLIIFLTGDKAPDKVKASFKSVSPPISRNLLFENGIAISNVPPLPSDPSPRIPLPLNTFVDIRAQQILTLTIKKSENPGVDFSKVTDVILGLDYLADLRK